MCIRDRNTPKWRLFLKISDSLYVLSKQKNGKTIYSPLAIHSLQFLRPKKLTDAEKFNIQYPNPAMLTTTADVYKRQAVYSVGN